MKYRVSFLKKVGLILILSSATISPGLSSSANSGWDPNVTERVITLPKKFLEKAIEKDFQESQLARDISYLRDEIAEQTKYIRELKEKSLNSSNHEKELIEVQIIEEKKALLANMNLMQREKREKIYTMISVYQVVLKKIKDTRDRSSPGDKELIENIGAARERSEQAVRRREDVYNSIISDRNNQYSKRYQENLNAINRLRATIMNVENEGYFPDSYIQRLSKEEYIKYILGNFERELSLIDQEKELLGLMTELVSYEAFKRDSILSNVGSQGAGNRQSDALSDIARNIFID